MKVDPAAADTTAVSLEGENLHSWDLATIAPDDLARRGTALGAEALAGFAGPLPEPTLVDSGAR